MINIYNNTTSPITIDYIVLEVGHNYIDPAQWAKISAKDEIREMQGEGMILVNNYNSYITYKNAIENLFLIVTDGSKIEMLKTLSGDDKASQIEELRDSIESSLIELELFHDEFQGISALEGKNKIILSTIKSKQNELEKLSKES